MTVPTRTPLNWVKPFCKKYADIREPVQYFLRTFPHLWGVEKGGRKRAPELVPRPSRNTWQGNKQQRSKSMKPSQPQSGSYLSWFLLYSWQIMEKRVTSGLAMKSPMTMSNPEIGLLAKHTCKRLVGVEKNLVLISIVLQVGMCPSGHGWIWIIFSKQKETEIVADVI